VVIQRVIGFPCKVRLSRSHSLCPHWYIHVSFPVIVPSLPRTTRYPSPPLSQLQQEIHPVPSHPLNNPLQSQPPNNQKNDNKKCCPEQRAEAGVAEKAVAQAATLVGGSWGAVVDGEA
jgi:hypothetical protein